MGGHDSGLTSDEGVEERLVEGKFVSDPPHASLQPPSLTHVPSNLKRKLVEMEMQNEECVAISPGFLTNRWLTTLHVVQMGCPFARTRAYTFMIPILVAFVFCSYASIYYLLCRGRLHHVSPRFFWHLYRYPPTVPHARPLTFSFMMYDQ